MPPVEQVRPGMSGVFALPDRLPLPSRICLRCATLHSVISGLAVLSRQAFLLGLGPIRQMNLHARHIGRSGRLSVMTPRKRMFRAPRYLRPPVRGPPHIIRGSVGPPGRMNLRPNRERAPVSARGAFWGCRTAGKARSRCTALSRGLAAFQVKRGPGLGANAPSRPVGGPYGAMPAFGGGLPRPNGEATQRRSPWLWGTSHERAGNGTGRRGCRRNRDAACGGNARYRPRTFIGGWSP